MQSYNEIKKMIEKMEEQKQSRLSSGFGGIISGSWICALKWVLEEKSYIPVSTDRGFTTGVDYKPFNGRDG